MALDLMTVPWNNVSDIFNDVIFIIYEKQMSQPNIFKIF